MTTALIILVSWIGYTLIGYASGLVAARIESEVQTNNEELIRTVWLFVVFWPLLMIALPLMWLAEIPSSIVPIKPVYRLINWSVERVRKQKKAQEASE